MTRFLFALLLALQFALTMAIQEPLKAAPAQAAAKSTAPDNDIFSGTVTASSPDSVKVVRKVPARADEYREFVVDKDTKIEGKLRVNARVTVRFKTDDDGAVHALRIIVRTDAKTGTSPGKATTAK